MKISLHKNEALEETEVKVYYPHMDTQTQHIVSYIQQCNCFLDVQKEEKHFRIPANEIFYIESVDNKTFCYDKENVYRIFSSLSSLEDLLKNTTLLRISKTCILNTTYLKCFYPYPNHRILAELKNGEQLIVSRKYIPSLKKNLKGEI